MMTEREKLKKSIKAHQIIKNHMIWSMGAGFIPLPVADMLAVTAIQLDMIRQLSKTYDVDFSESEVKAIVSSLTSSGLAGLGARAVKVVPVVGSILGGVTMSALSGAATYALGEVFYKHFESGGSFLNFNPEKVKDFYKERYNEGKKIAKEMNDAGVQAEVPVEEQELKTVTKDDALPQKAITQLERLAALRDNGVLNDEEFEDMKRRVMESDLVHHDK